ncbi:MAG: hypothetical protein WAN35_01830 [Terracidiphilus sp.]|jgi:hypothetical protein
MLVLLGNSLLPDEEHYRHALESAGYHVAGEDLDRIHQDGSVVGLVNAENAVAQLNEWRHRFSRIHPVIIGDATAFVDSEDLALASAPTLALNVTTAEILKTFAFLSRGDGWLLKELAHLDPKAKQLVEDEFCEWVRSRPGIIGIVQLARFEPKQQLDCVLSRLIDHAYTLLDGLPQERLSVQDIWNVTLLISVPIGKEELDRGSDVVKSLDALAQNVTGSRKLVLWFDRTVGEYFGRLGEGRESWKLSSDDPLRQTLERVAANSEERNALEVIFKSRLSQEDIDELLQELSKHT